MNIYLILYGILGPFENWRKAIIGFVKFVFGLFARPYGITGFPMDRYLKIKT
jgi:hypothetical protein